MLRTREEKVLYLLYRWHRNSHSAGSHRRIDISFPDLLYMLRNTRIDVDDSPKELKDDIIDKKDVCLTVDQNIEEVNKTKLLLVKYLLWVILGNNISLSKLENTTSCHHS